MSCLTILDKLGFTYRVTLAKKIKDRFEDCCIECAVGEIKEDDADSACLKIISRGGLTVPSYSELCMLSICTAQLLQWNY